MIDVRSNFFCVDKRLTNEEKNGIKIERISAIRQQGKLRKVAKIGVKGVRPSQFSDCLSNQRVRKSLTTGGDRKQEKEIRDNLRCF